LSASIFGAGAAAPEYQMLLFWPRELRLRPIYYFLRARVHARSNLVSVGAEGQNSIIKGCAARAQQDERHFLSPTRNDRINLGSASYRNASQSSLNLSRIQETNFTQR
jgi:hypothetical protein